MNFRKFLLRDVMHRRALCCRAVSVCPSGCLSRSCKLIVLKRVNNILKLFSLSGRPTILFFTKPYGDIPTGSTLTGVSNAGI